MFSIFRKPKPQKRFSRTHKVAYYQIRIGIVTVRNCADTSTADVLQRIQTTKAKTRQKPPVNNQESRGQG